MVHLRAVFNCNDSAEPIFLSGLTYGTAVLVCGMSTSSNALSRRRLRVVPATTFTAKSHRVSEIKRERRQRIFRLHEGRKSVETHERKDCNFRQLYRWQSRSAIKNRARPRRKSKVLTHTLGHWSLGLVPTPCLDPIIRVFSQSKRQDRSLSLNCYNDNFPASQARDNALSNQFSSCFTIRSAKRRKFKKWWQRLTIWSPRWRDLISSPRNSKNLSKKNRDRDDPKAARRLQRKSFH